ncbi:MAG: YggS family pyridoxal phosphate-dependent enzyme [Candidatus Eisenbacteria bacterium]|uniref:Pyridoxal phosphate homeostasis protein n=1 Tax=Eiseniibacteriota bacterium TaxID=2212470 RepID=A0A948RXB0_UNCEI|nr:YggS family pyridoxal phosphate-dependent enzyme [Candidatus Eisenbacteria bacterium]MBU1947140.1 YggS family pyridoxal phosphate-dependent enzyme [Candidatus Eisenbacteria bacterium]MBU2692565.1 YggS family pyridoxal phosphate-dependent enzyme [Candidatus Eisenbacteria bacterium]
MNEDLLRERFQNLQARVAEAARRVGRSAEEITIVGVTKKFPPAVLATAAQVGIRHVGENRVQELVEKQDALPAVELIWHMVGPLQTNKINKILGRIRLLQSLDRIELADALQKRLASPLDCLVEIKIAEETTKHGIDPDELPAFLDKLVTMDKIRVKGLMTVGPLTDDPSMIRKAFRRVADLFEKEKKRNRPGAEFRFLSMGMSDDFEIAIEEGSRMIRVGTALFGPRPSP